MDCHSASTAHWLRMALESHYSWWRRRCPTWDPMERWTLWRKQAKMGLSTICVSFHWHADVTEWERLVYRYQHITLAITKRATQLLHQVKLFKLNLRLVLPNSYGHSAHRTEHPSYLYQDYSRKYFPTFNDSECDQLFHNLAVIFNRARVKSSIFLPHFVDLQAVIISFKLGVRAQSTLVPFGGPGSAPVLQTILLLSPNSAVSRHDTRKNPC